MHLPRSFICQLHCVFVLQIRHARWCYVHVPAPEGHHPFPDQQVPELGKSIEHRKSACCKELLVFQAPIQKYCIKWCYFCEATKLQELFVVVKTDTVVCPHTVMVHHNHALITNTAMMCSQRLHKVAFFANQAFLFINRISNLQKGIRILDRDGWISEYVRHVSSVVLNQVWFNFQRRVQCLLGFLGLFF